VAAIAEALGRNADDPARLRTEDLLLVSIGTGRFESGFTQAEVSGWGQLGWLLGGGDHPIISAMLGGDSDGTDYWAHMLLNHAPGEARPSPAEIGRDGSRFYRLQAALEGPLGLDDASPRAIVALEDAAAAVIEDRGPVLDRIAERLAAPATMPRND
jgi:hypothetical protein